MPCYGMAWRGIHAATIDITIETRPRNVPGRLKQACHDMTGQDGIGQDRASNFDYCIRDCCPVDQVGFRVVGCGVLWYGLEMIIEHDALEGLNYYGNRIIVL